MADGETTGTYPAEALRASARHFRHAAAFSALLNVLYLTPTLFMLQVYDRVIATRGTATLVALVAILVFAVATIGTIELARARLFAAAGIRIDRLLSGPIIDRLLAGAAAGGTRSGALLRDFDGFRQAVTGPAAVALFDAPWSVIYLLACFLLHPLIGAAAVVASALLGTVAFLNERATKRPILEANRAAAHAARSLDSTLAHAGTVRALGMGSALAAGHLAERRTAGAFQARGAAAAAGYVTVTKATRLLLQSLALALGAWLAIAGRISPGAIFAASLLIGRALSPVEQITAGWKPIAQARSTYAALAALLAERPPAPARTRLPDPVGLLSVEGLSVAAPDGRLLVEDVSFEAAPGDVIGIIGPSGAGKSTLAKAIVGALPPAAGTVRIDGASVADWPEDQLARAIGYVPQEPSLLRGTVKENVSRFAGRLGGDAAAIDAEVVRVSQLCGTQGFVLRLPHAYDTELSWAGTGLSVGQAQRVALSRALYGRPRIVVLDEPNASLDAEGEAHLAAALRALREEGATVLIVAHRPGVLETANKLLVIRDGRMAMFGERSAVVQALSRVGKARPTAVPAAA